MNRIAFVHTSTVPVPAFTKLARELLPGIDFFHVVDESLLRNTIREGRMSKETLWRAVSLIGHAHQGGAEAVMLTCSSIGESVEVAREVFDFPVFRVDEAMAAEAVSRGRRIGVAATLNSTLDPTIALLRRTAAGRPVDILPRLCEGAFDAVSSGDVDTHDRLLVDALQPVIGQVDVLVLAQASMARVLPLLATGSTPVLTSPELGVRHMRDSLAIQ